MANYKPASAGNAYEAENTFYLRGHPTRLAKLLSHYELYREITALPGAVVELGVYKGASLVRFATFRNILENAHSRPLIGFDIFGEFPRREVEGEADRKFIENFESTGGEGISKDDLASIFSEKGFANVQLVEGNIFSTLPNYLAENPALKVALLHLDMDVYEPTAFALQHFMSRMVRGGIVMFDDYGLVEGATRAADEVCQQFNMSMAKLSNYVIPGFFRIP